MTRIKIHDQKRGGRIKESSTVSFKNLDQGSEMINFKSIWTTFEASLIF